MFGRTKASLSPAGNVLVPYSYNRKKYSPNVLHHTLLISMCLCTSASISNVMYISHEIPLYVICCYNTYRTCILAFKWLSNIDVKVRTSQNNMISPDSVPLLMQAWLVFVMLLRLISCGNNNSCSLLWQWLIVFHASYSCLVSYNAAVMCVSIYTHFRAWNNSQPFSDHFQGFGWVNLIC